MKIAIVGTSGPLTCEENLFIKSKITEILAKHMNDETVVVSGGAEGVDNIASMVAISMGIRTKIFYPIQRTWKFFRQRNIKIASICDDLYCFTVINRTDDSKCYHHSRRQNHEKTAGCWTLNYAKNLGKPTSLYVAAQNNILLAMS